MRAHEKSTTGACTRACFFSWVHTANAATVSGRSPRACRTLHTTLTGSDWKQRRIMRTGASEKQKKGGQFRRPQRSHVYQFGQANAVLATVRAAISAMESIIISFVFIFVLLLSRVILISKLWELLHYREYLFMRQWPMWKRQ